MTVSSAYIRTEACLGIWVRWLTYMMMSNGPKNGALGHSSGDGLLGGSLIIDQGSLAAISKVRFKPEEGSAVEVKFSQSF